MMRHLNHLKDKFVSRLFARFFIGGIAGYVFSMAFTWIFTEIFQLDYFVFYVLSLTAVTIFNFIVAMRFIFRLHDHYSHRFVKYLISVLIFYFANILLVRLSVNYLNIHYLISITIVTGGLFLIKFLIYDRFVFHRT